MKSLLFSLVLCLTLNKAHGIYGGCMSYSSSPSNVPGHIEVKLNFLNGWELHRGPCYNCTENDEGSDVTERRKQFITDRNDPEAFGSWSLEEHKKSMTTIKHITLLVNDNIRDVVLMVNKHEGWELESSEINILLPINMSKPDFDVVFQNLMDGYLTNMGRSVNIYQQVKVDPYNRSDTQKPNRSPVILVKPYYSLERGKTHTLHIPVVDNDDDKTKCEFSSYVEAGALSLLLRNLTSANIVEMNDKEDCVLTINLNNTRFSVGDAFALPITVKDHNRKFMVSVAVYHPYSYPIGRTTILMYFKVTGRTDPPDFIPPTPPNNQAYTVYVGGYFYINVYAKPTDTSRRIIKFNFLRRDGTRVQKTAIQSVPGDPAAVYISMEWSPVDSDIGKHIVCANAEDSNGISTVNLRCFIIDVKATIFRPHPPKLGKPYFASIPYPQDIICYIYSYCLFPVVAATDNTGGIVGITSTDMSEENITIYYSPDVINGTIHTKIAEVEFLALTPGPRKICLNATDRFQWTVGCLIVAVERQDPCESTPCHNNGRCTAYKDKSGFICTCPERFNGTYCETRIKVCQQRPCVGSNACFDVDILPYFICLQCPPGKTGTRCEVGE